MAKVIKNGKYGWLNSKGKEVIPLQYDSASYFREGLVSVMKNDKYGFVNQNGVEVVPCQYVFASDFFDDGSAVVFEERKKFRINKQGDIIE